MRKRAHSIPANPLSTLDPADLQNGLHNLLKSYQTSRCQLRALMVVHFAEALCRHPDLDEPDEQRCAYHRLARQWRWLAVASSDETLSDNLARTAA